LKEASENGITVGYIIIIRAKYKGLKLRDVAACLKQTSDFYMELAEEKDKILKQGSKTQALGREEKGGLRKEEQVTEMQAARLILCVLATAMEQVVNAAAAEHKASAAKK
jgi:hypothetical protein